jgi:serine/alanine adding enzyme
MTLIQLPTISVRLCTDLKSTDWHEWQRFTRQFGTQAQYCDPRWLSALCNGLRHKPYVLLAERGDRLVGVLPLAFVKSALFGRFLVALPYVNSGGVVAENGSAATELMNRAVKLADELDVRYLELRHEVAMEHPALVSNLTHKVHMRLALPSSKEDLWKGFTPKVRNQLRKADRYDLSVHWGGVELLGEFYKVFSRNMRDLGTPVFGRGLFRNILLQFRDDAEICVVQLGRRPIAAGLLVHGKGITEVPSASCLRRWNEMNANMFMYKQLLQRAIDRGQNVFDFGRSSIDSPTYRFKKQWGARPHATAWQYYIREGTVGAMRPENSKYQRMIKIWRRLPVSLTCLIGPLVVRGIP